MYHSAELIKAEFDIVGLTASVIDTDISVVAVPISVQDGPILYANFLARNDDNDVTLMICVFDGIDDSRYDGLTDVLNKVNSDIRFLRFYLNADSGTVLADYTFPMNLSDDSLSECAVEMWIRSGDIMNKVFHTIRKQIYS